MSLQAELHRAHIERLKRLGAVPVTFGEQQSVIKNLRTVVEMLRGEIIGLQEELRLERANKRSENPVSDVTVKEIVEIVSRETRVPSIEIVGESRHKSVITARQLVMYLATKHSRKSKTAIARALSDRDHTTVIHGYNRVAARLHAGDPELADLVTVCERRLLNNPEMTIPLVDNPADRV